MNSKISPPEVEYTGKPELDAGVERTVSEIFSKLSDRDASHEIAEGRMLNKDSIVYEMAGDRPERQELPGSQA
jgi:hypothetical protein